MTAISHYCGWIYFYLQNMISKWDLVLCVRYGRHVIQNECGQAVQRQTLQRHASRISNALNNCDYKDFKERGEGRRICEQDSLGKTVAMLEYPSPLPAPGDGGRREPS